jgi:putative ABC transport system ATP-binding protein
MRSNGKVPHPRVVVRGVERSFGSGDTVVRVLRSVDLQVAPGERVALYGPSGSGKTTLLNLIGALDRPNAGSICIDDQDILKMSDRQRAKLRRKRVGFIFQSYTLVPTYTAYENVDLALRLPGIGYFERRRRTKAALAAVGLTAWADHVPDELSGGQRQRVAVARALALQPALILADEPTSGLDSRTARRILALFEAIAHAQGTTFLIVSHDPMVANTVDVAYDLHDGRLVPHGSLKEQLP